MGGAPRPEGDDSRLVLFTMGSPFCEKVELALRYKGVSFQRRLLSLREAMRPARQGRPKGSLPCLRAGGSWVTDSARILRTLDGLFPDRSLQPAPERARTHDAIESWADRTLHAYEQRFVFEDALATRRLMDELVAADPLWFRQPARFWVPRAMRWRLRRGRIAGGNATDFRRRVLRELEHLDRLLVGGGFLGGAAPSYADLAVHVQLDRIARTREGAPLLEPLGALRRWAASLRGVCGAARPAA